MKAASSEILNEIKKVLPEWPSKGAEAEYYEPVVDTINTVRNILKKHRTTSVKAVYDDHHLCVYNREMYDSVERDHPMKPDLILKRGEKLKPTERARWRDVDVAIEVKSDWRNLVLQAATYARALFYSNWTRTFALVIGINHTSRSARFMFFHRGGMTSTRELTMDGENPIFKDFVRMLDTIFSCSEPETAGFLSTAPDDCSDKPEKAGDCKFGGITILSTRTCIRGRANRVAFLSPQEEINPIPLAAPPKTQYDTDLGNSRRKKPSGGAQLPPASNFIVPSPSAGTGRPPPKGQASLAAEVIPSDTTSHHSNTTIDTTRNISGAGRPPPPGEASPAAEVIQSDATSHQSNTTTDTKRSTSLVDASPNDAEALADALAFYRLRQLQYINKDHSTIRTKIATKDSWPVDRSVELDMYSTSSGQFGLPVLQ
jgi:hypothetical protein